MTTTSALDHGGDENVVPHSVVGGVTDADESQACALEFVIDNLLL